MEFVEKDFWITELLRSVSSPVEKAFTIFKGGTSLSKGYGMLQRFSEDVDILLVVEEEMGKGAVDRALKRICSRAGEALGIGEEDQELEASSKGIHRSIRFAYPAQVGASVVRPGVMLEIGVRGGPEPRETREIRSFLSEFAVENLDISQEEYDELAPFHIPILSPERTLMEKLALLHHLGSAFPESEEQLRRSGRHIYDVHRLLETPLTVERLRETADLAGSLSRDIEERSVRSGWKATARPERGYASTPIFDPTHPCFEAVETAYDSARALIYGYVPSLDECRASVLKHASLL